MPWYLYLALKQLFSGNILSSLFTVTSVVGVMLGVMILVIIQSIMNGSTYSIEEKIIGINGHIRIEEEGALCDWQSMRKKIEIIPEIQTISPYVVGIVMLEYNQIPAFPIVRGLDIGLEGVASSIQNLTVFERSDSLDDNAVLVGIGLAQRMNIRLGSKIDVYTPLMLDRIRENEFFLPRELTVIGIIDSGWHEIDDNTIITTLRLMQDLHGLGEAVHGISLKVDENIDIDTIKSKIEKIIVPSSTIFTWHETNRDFFFILRLEKTILLFVVVFIILIACFSISSSLMLIVTHKTQEIGFLGAMGALPRDIALQYCCQDFIVGFSGTIIGIANALLSLNFRGAIIRCLVSCTHSEVAVLKYYKFSHIPIRYIYNDFIMVFIVAMTLSVAAGLLPALRAARMNPADALRHT